MDWIYLVSLLHLAPPCHMNFVQLVSVEWNGSDVLSWLRTQIFISYNCTGKLTFHSWVGRIAAPGAYSINKQAVALFIFLDFSRFNALYILKLSQSHFLLLLCYFLPLKIIKSFEIEIVFWIKKLMLLPPPRWDH